MVNMVNQPTSISASISLEAGTATPSRQSDTVVVTAPVDVPADESVDQNGTPQPLGKKTDEIPRILYPNGTVLSPLIASTFTDTLLLGSGMSKVFKNTLAMRRKNSRNRLFEKNGQINLSWHNVPKANRMWFTDIFTTLVEMQWRWLLIAFIVSFLMSWVIFALFFYLTQYAHGDYDLKDDSGELWCANDSLTCIVNSCDFLSCFYFSLESQATIGFGSRYPTTNEGCWAIGLLMPWQTIWGVAAQTLMAGLVFAKIARPNKRASTIMFSDKAVIELVDGVLCLLFRLGDMRTSQLAEAHVRLQMVKTRTTDEGELYPFHQVDMDVGYDTGEDRVFMVWPIVITHKIDENSPLYEIGKQDLETTQFEIIAILEGTIQSSGNTTHARTSYLPNEIQWGYRFEKLVSYQRDDGKYRINFERFNNTYEVSCPEISAAKIDEMKEAGLAPEAIYAAQGPEDVENEGQSPYDTIHLPSEAPRNRRPSIRDHEMLVRKLTMLDRKGSTLIEEASKKSSLRSQVSNPMVWLPHSNSVVEARRSRFATDADLTGPSGSKLTIFGSLPVPSEIMSDTIHEHPTSISSTAPEVSTAPDVAQTTTTEMTTTSTSSATEDMNNHPVPEVHLELDDDDDDGATSDHGRHYRVSANGRKKSDLSVKRQNTLSVPVDD